MALDSNHVLESLSHVQAEAVVRGMEDTLINGQAGPVVVGGVRDDIFVDLKGGNDRFRAGQASANMPDSFTLKMQDGDDYANLQYLNVPGNATIGTGSGNDCFGWDKIRRENRPTLDGGTGYDILI